MHTQTNAHGEKINLVMSGGGVRLAAYVGAVTAFRDMGLQFGAIASASAGSIVGAFLAAGWSPERMYAKVMETDFTLFKDRKLKSLMFEGGLYAGNVFERWVEAELQGARFCDLPTDLFVVAADLIGRQPFIFSRHTTPELSVSKAVRCSMAIPWVWRPQRWEGKLLADGQLLPWIPTGIQLMKTSPAGEGAVRTLVLRLLSEPRQDLPAKRTLWPWDYARLLLDTMFAALENQRVPGPLWEDTILIQVGQIPPLQLKLSRANREILFQCGYDQAHRYFHKASADPSRTPPRVPSGDRARPMVSS